LVLHQTSVEPCSNNPKQLGLAAANYHPINNCFPPGGLPASRVGGGLSGAFGSWSAFAFMPPQLEQSPPFNANNFGLVNVGDETSISEYQQSTTVLARINTPLGPSSPSPTGNIRDRAFALGPAPGNNHFASFGSSLEFDGTQPGGPPSGIHRYVFWLSALDARLNLEVEVTRESLLRAMKGHVLAEGRLMG
jgi:hypothetical protein